MSRRHVQAAPSAPKSAERHRTSVSRVSQSAAKTPARKPARGAKPAASDTKGALSTKAAAANGVVATAVAKSRSDERSLSTGAIRRSNAPAAGSPAAAKGKSPTSKLAEVAKTAKTANGQNGQNGLSRPNGQNGTHRQNGKPTEKPTEKPTVSNSKNGAVRATPGRGSVNRQFRPTENSSADSLEGEFCEPGWLRVQWSVSHATRLRAASQLGGGWVAAQTVLRVMDVSRGDVSTTASRVLAEIPLPADASLWFVPVSRTVQLVRAHIAFVKDAGRYVSVLQSPVIKSARVPVEELTAVPAGDSVMSTSVSKSRRRSRRRAALNPQSGPVDLGPTVAQMAATTLSQLDLSAELRLSGRAQPRSRITFDDQQILVDATGTFSATLSQPEGRQVIGLTIASPDGRRKQTVVFSLEKNTRVLEPDIHDHDTGDEV